MRMSANTSKGAALRFFSYSVDAKYVPAIMMPQAITKRMDGVSLKIRKESNTPMKGATA